jgi:hypothetical protein
LCMQVLLTTMRHIRRIVGACQTIRNCPDIFGLMLRSLMSRVTTRA